MSDIDDRLRFLLTGDDGSVDFDQSRLPRCIRDWASSNGHRIKHNHAAFAAGGGCNVCLVDSMRNVVWFENGPNRYFSEDDAALCIFECRHNQPYQQSIEAFVNAHREPAAPMDPLQVIEECRKLGISVCPIPLVEIYRVDVQYQRGKLGSNTFHCTYGALADTIRRAACAALEEVRKTIW